MRELKLDDCLLLPKQLNCYGYGVEPVTGLDRYVKVTEVEKHPDGILITAETRTGQIIYFAQNTTSNGVYANTISNIRLIDNLIQ